MSEPVRIYFDGTGVDAPPGSSVLDALGIARPGEAASVRAGEKQITDSRGLPADPNAVIYNGAIFRLIRARSRGDEESPNTE